MLVAKRNFNIPAGRQGAKINLRVSGTGRKLAFARKGVQVKATAQVKFGSSRTFKRTKTLRATR